MTSALDTLPLTDRMPALFVGHGSPENALADNAYTRALRALGSELPRPAAVLVVSAHWLTRGVGVLGVAKPRTIHDFYGFPRPLYEIEYPAAGSPACAAAVAELTGATLDDSWGLDHASWAVLRHVFPDADVPTLELSLDPRMSSEAHVALARRLRPLRDRGVLVVGSGNCVHNLRAIDWSDDAEPFDWAVEFDAWVAERLESGDTDALAGYESLGRLAQLAAPTNDHYLPLLYAAALRDEGEPLGYVHEGIDNGSISMRCVKVG